MTELMPMPVIERAAEEDDAVDGAELAAAAFLARYQGRTLDAYRYDLRAFFQWAADDRLDILKATRPQIELYVRAMEARGLAASTIDRRLSTVCGFYRFAHIDGRIASNPAQYVRRPKVHPRMPVVSTAPSSVRSCSRQSGSTTPTPPWRCSWASTACG
jgi:site-specific recombinase XerD